MPRHEAKQECQLKRNRVPHVRDSLIVANVGILTEHKQRLTRAGNYNPSANTLS